MQRALTFLFVVVLPSVATAADLTVNNAWDHAKVMVYELPEADGRAEAVRYVESVRDQFMKGGEIVDAAANESSLKSKLKDGFVLYTTLGEKSKVLRLATRKLGWFHELAASTGELRLILAGKNPYSKGYCVIYAATSNHALTGINEVFHGPSSYYVFRGKELLREGSYDENFISIEHVSPAAALEDVNQFFKTLQRVHPNLLRNVSEDSYRTLKEQTAAGVNSKLDSKGEIPVEELASLLYYAAAYFKDGHTAVHWQPSLNEWNTRGKRFPAFRLAFDNEHFVIASAKDPKIVNMELVSVNGTPALEFLRPILDRCSGEMLGFRAARFIANEPFWYYLTNLFGGAGEYMLRVRDAEGQEREVALETLNYTEYQARTEPFRPNAQGTKVEFFDAGATAHFMYSSFSLSAAEKKKVDDVFAAVQTKGARNLILDLRGNWGGQSNMAEYIFRYLYGEKFRSFRAVRIKVSMDILPQVPWWARPMILGFNGHVVSHSIGEHAEPKPRAFFRGRVYLLIDNGSFSMATDFAAMIRDYKVGTIVGYETGGLPQTFASPYHFTLKNSRIPCAVSWTENLPAMPWPGDDQHGVIPDVPLNDQQLAEFMGEQDPVLAYTLRYVKRLTD